MTKIGNTLIALAMIVSSASAFAAGTTVQSSADRTEVGAGEPFAVTIAVVTNENVDIQDPRLPDLTGFELMNTQQRTAVAQKLVPAQGGMKFETQRRQEYIYTLSASRQGTLSVGAFEVIIGGKVFRSEPIVIKVGSAGSGQQGQQRPQQQQQQRQRHSNAPPGFDDMFEAMDQQEEEMFNQLLQQRQRLMQQMPNYDDDPRRGGGGGAFGGGGSVGMDHPAYRSLPTNPNEAFFIGVEIDKTEVFEGEQVTVNWYIYTRGQMETLDRLKFPALRGFWKEIIEEVPSIQFYEEIVNGTPWKKALLASHALFPIKAGSSAVVDEYKIKSRVRLPTQGFGFFGKPYEYTKSSSRVPIKVKPLPVEGRPSDFTGAVGQFEVHATVDNPNVPVNQPFSLKVRFEGSGNAKLIDLPVLNLPPGMEQYDSKSESKFFKNGRSYKEFEVLLIPRQEGEVQIPAMSVSMFDPASQKYYTRTTQPVTIKVVNNPNAPVGESSRMSDAQTKAKAAAPAKTLPNPLMQWEPSVEASIWTHPGVWIAIYAGIIVMLAWKALRTFGWHQRRQTLQEMVAKRYKKVDQALSAKDHRMVGVEMTNIFYVVLGEVAGRGGASEEIHRLLEQIPPSVRRDHGTEIEKTFEIFQTLSFAPDEALGALKDPSTMKTNVDKAKKVIGAVISAVDEKVAT